MGKGASSQLFSNSGQAMAASNAENANASNIYGGLEPTLQAEASHPSGYTPMQKAQMNTAAQQSAGGSESGAVGQGGLYAARTKNAGAAQNAIGSAVALDRIFPKRLSEQRWQMQTLPTKNSSKGFRDLVDCILLI